MYQYDQRPNTSFTAESEPILADLRSAEYGVLIGRNNCGKSFILKTLTQRWGDSASYLGPARYNNFNTLGYYTPNKNRRREFYRQFVDQFQKNNQNFDNSPVNLQQAIAELSDAQRERLFEIVRLLLNHELQILDTVPGNSMSQKYISCSGHNISFTSSGFRLITTIITSLLNTDYDTFLIDEPELGISPEAQGILADFLFDRAHRAKYFPHIKTLVFATHSTVFLDRFNISNNYRIQKRGDSISVARVSSQAEFNNVHFFLLGNRFETLYLPSLIVIVEGKTDHKFIDRLLATRYPNYQFSVICADCDNRIKEVLFLAKGIFSDIQKSPYRDRIYVILDATHEKGLPGQLYGMGIPRDKIIVWPKNGIEYYLPPKIIDEIYGTGAELSIEGDKVSRNGATYTKNELCEKVLARMNKDTEMSHDLNELLLRPLENTLGI